MARMDTVDEKTAAEALKEFELKTIKGVEIFAPGKWNGDTYTEADLDGMVDAFGKQGFRPPVKLGHKEASGSPAYGWVENLRKQGQKLVADLVDLPETVYNDIKNRRFDTVSSEVFWNLTRGKDVFKRALKGVALLGAEIPAVAGLKPLREAQFSEEAEVKTVAFTINSEPEKPGILNPPKVEEDMDAKEFKALQDKNAELEQKIAKLEAEHGDSEAVKELKAELKQRDERLNKIEEERRQERIVTTVGACKVPAYHELLKPLLDVATTTETKEYTLGTGDKAEKVDAFGVIEKLIDRLNKDAELLFKKFSHDIQEPKDVDAQGELNRKITEYRAKETSATYEQAMNAVLAADPELKEKIAGLEA